MKVQRDETSMNKSLCNIAKIFSESINHIGISHWNKTDFLSFLAIDEKFISET